jgi:hypothetical protein
MVLVLSLTTLISLLTIGLVGWRLRAAAGQTSERSSVYGPARLRQRTIPGGLRRSPGVPTPEPPNTPPRVLSRAQVAFLVAIAVGITSGIATSPALTVAIVNGILIVFFMAAYGLKLVLIGSSLRHPAATTIRRPPKPLALDQHLPVYTVLLPLYHEVAVLPQLVKGISDLHYPQELLDVKLLLEEGDVATRRAVA